MDYAMEIYLDNCCFNRPYDDQTHLQIELETQAKLYIQEQIKQRKISLATSFVLLFENSQNPYMDRKIMIKDFIDKYSSKYISVHSINKIQAKTQEIMQMGIKWKDATHLACAIYAKCDYFLTTDKRLLKYQSQEISIINPLNFIAIME